MVFDVSSFQGDDLVDTDVIQNRFVGVVVSVGATGVSIFVEENGSGISGLGRSGVSVGVFFSVEKVGVNSV